MFVGQEIDKSLDKIKILFKCSGMNLEDREIYFKELCIYILHLLWIGIDIVGAFHWIYEGINKGISFIELTHVAPCFNMGMIALIKMCYFLKNNKKVHELIKTLRELERKKLLKEEHIENIVEEEMKYLNAVINILSWVTGTMLILFDFSPLVLIAVKYIKTKELTLLLPFLDIYPVDCYDLTYWPFAYFHQMYTAYLVLMQILAIDFLFYICCTHIKIQFRILQRDIENMIPKKGAQGMRQEIKEKLNEWVRSHQIVIREDDIKLLLSNFSPMFDRWKYLGFVSLLGRSADSLETIYSKSTLFNYISSSIVICLTGFMVTVVDDIAIVVTFACIFTGGMLQILFFCCFGDMLMISSTDINKAAYNCRWYLADTGFGRNILTIQIRSRKPCKLTAAGYADVNFNAFMKILSTSWSYFALLQTVYKSSRD